MSQIINDHASAHSPAGPITFANSYASTNTGNDQATFTVDPVGIVRLRGRITKASPAAGETIFTLPPGMRPLVASAYFPVVCSGGTLGVVEVTSAGLVIYRAGTASTWMSLDGVSYPASQTL